MYRELKRELKAIRQKRGVSNYIKWNESRASVDEFYRKNTFGADSLYDRLTTLRERSETFKSITIPVYITLVFGIFVAVGFNVAVTILKTKNEFLVNAQAILDKKLLTSSPESVQEAIAIYDKIVNETLLWYALMSAGVILCLILIALAFAYLLYPLHSLNSAKVAVHKYEAGTIQRLLECPHRTVSVKCEDALFPTAVSKSTEQNGGFAVN
jgi:hypothetical protein